MHQGQNGGVDGVGIDQRLVALNIDDDFGVFGGGDFGDAVGAGRWSARVMRTRAPKFACNFVDRSSSVAMIVLVRYRAWEARSYTCCSMVLEAMGARTLPGKREEANRAGITPRILRGTARSYHKIRCVRLGKERLASRMMLPSYRKLLLFSAIVHCAGALAAAGAARPKVRSTPRPKPVEKSEAPVPRPTSAWTARWC